MALKITFSPHMLLLWASLCRLGNGLYGAGAGQNRLVVTTTVTTNQLVSLWFPAFTTTVTQQLTNDKYVIKELGESCVVTNTVTTDNQPLVTRTISTTATHWQELTPFQCNRDLVIKCLHILSITIAETATANLSVAEGKTALFRNATSTQLFPTTSETRKISTDNSNSPLVGSFWYEATETESDGSVVVAPARTVLP